MSKTIPKQQLPVIDPNKPEGDATYRYYILEEPKSPSVTPPNAIRVVQYARRQFIHSEDEDYRRPYGYVDYSHELTFGELDAYNLLPFDPDQITLFDLWQSFEKDKAVLLIFFGGFFEVIEGDPELYRLGLAIKLAGREWTLKKAKAAVKRIK